MEKESDTERKKEKVKMPAPGQGGVDGKFVTSELK